MHKDKAQIEIEKHLMKDESLIGFFMAQKKPPFWLYFVLGPLAPLGLKVYFVSVTTFGVHFHKLSLLDKFSQHDFFAFNEIQDVKIGTGLLQTPIQYTFSNGTKLKIHAQKKGMDKIAKITDPVITYLSEHIKVLR